MSPEVSSLAHSQWRTRQEASRATISKLAEVLALARRAFNGARNSLAKQRWFHPLCFQQVQALLTLFSKSFSSFPHGTCVLSVSSTYLALDEIYHPLCAPIPRNVTLQIQAVYGGLQIDKRDSHPRRRSLSRGLNLRLRWRCISRLQFEAIGPDIKSELFPVRSPLLRESYLVSHPPLTYMLKFSGFADLTSCLEVATPMGAPTAQVYRNHLTGPK